jgi:hypothetical protein
MENIYFYAMRLNFKDLIVVENGNGSTFKVKFRMKSPRI